MAPFLALYVALFPALALAACTWTPLGCYTDSVFCRTLQTVIQVPRDPGFLTAEECQQICRQWGFTLAGVVDGAECFCDNIIKNNAQLAPDGNAGCQTPCAAYPTEMCAAADRIEVYTCALEQVSTLTSSLEPPICSCLTAGGSNGLVTPFTVTETLTVEGNTAIEPGTTFTVFSISTLGETTVTILGSALATTVTVTNVVASTVSLAGATVTIPGSVTVAGPTVTVFGSVVTDIVTRSGSVTLAETGTTVTVSGGGVVTDTVTNTVTIDVTTVTVLESAAAATVTLTALETVTLAEITDTLSNGIITNTVTLANSTVTVAGSVVTQTVQALSTITLAPSTVTVGGSVVTQTVGALSTITLAGSTVTVTGSIITETIGGLSTITLAEITDTISGSIITDTITLADTATITRAGATVTLADITVTQAGSTVTLSDFTVTVAGSTVTIPASITVTKLGTTVTLPVATVTQLGTTVTLPASIVTELGTTVTLPASIVTETELGTTVTLSASIVTELGTTVTLPASIVTETELGTTVTLSASIVTEPGTTVTLPASIVTETKLGTTVTLPASIETEPGTTITLPASIVTETEPGTTVTLPASIEIEPGTTVTLPASIVTETEPGTTVTLPASIVTESGTTVTLRGTTVTSVVTSVVSTVSLLPLCLTGLTSTDFRLVGVSNDPAVNLHYLDATIDGKVQWTLDPTAATLLTLSTVNSLLAFSGGIPYSAVYSDSFITFPSNPPATATYLESCSTSNDHLYCELAPFSTPGVWFTCAEEALRFDPGGEGGAGCTSVILDIIPGCDVPPPQPTGPPSCLQGSPSQNANSFALWAQSGDSVSNRKYLVSSETDTTSWTFDPTKATTFTLLSLQYIPQGRFLELIRSDGFIAFSPDQIPGDNVPLSFHVPDDTSQDYLECGTGLSPPALYCNSGTDSFWSSCSGALYLNSLGIGGGCDEVTLYLVYPC